MAVIKLKEGNSYNTYTQTWLADTADELNGIIDRHQGDIGQLADGTTYCCNSSGNWVLQSSGGGGATGDMSADVYDPYRNVAEAGGIEEYVEDMVEAGTAIEGTIDNIVAIGRDNHLHDTTVNLKTLQLTPLVVDDLVLPALDWDGNELFVNFPYEVHEYDLFEVSPTTFDDAKKCADGEVWCTGYDEQDGGLYFECGDNTPESDITMTVVVFPQWLIIH